MHSSASRQSVELAVPAAGPAVALPFRESQPSTAELPAHCFCMHSAQSRSTVAVHWPPSGNVTAFCRTAGPEPADGGLAVGAGAGEDWRFALVAVAGLPVESLSSLVLEQLARKNASAAAVNTMVLLRDQVIAVRVYYAARSITAKSLWRAAGVLQFSRQ